MATTVTLATSQVKVLVALSVTFAWKLFSIVVSAFLNHVMPRKICTCLAISRIDGVESDIEPRLRTFQVNRWSKSVCHTHGQGRMLRQAASRKLLDRSSLSPHIHATVQVMVVEILLVIPYKVMCSRF
jgi:hypothetical protein